MATTPAAPTYSVLQYTYVADIAEKRGPYRQEHLAAAQSMKDADKLVMAGAVGSPIEGGVFIFKNATKEEIEAYVESDSYNRNGLITSWSIKPYMVAVGP